MSWRHPNTMIPASSNLSILVFTVLPDPAMWLLSHWSTASSGTLGMQAFLGILRRRSIRVPTASTWAFDIKYSGWKKEGHSPALRMCRWLKFPSSEIWISPPLDKNYINLSVMKQIGNVLGPWSPKMIATKTGGTTILEHSSTFSFWKHICNRGRFLRWVRFVIRDRELGGQRCDGIGSGIDVLV